MFLPWIGVEVFSYVDLLWQLATNPPLANIPDHNDHTFLRASYKQLANNPPKVPQVIPNHSISSPHEKPATYSPKVPQVIPNASIPSSRIFALFIGIDNYAHERNLRGAVHDARVMREYVQHTFKVPDHQIIELLNEKASRENIIAGFRALANNDFQELKINRGDPILIYYAGHGDLIIAPEESSGRRDNKIQSIVPQDFCEGKVDVIPDRTIGSLIDTIAKKHDDNITVIFDCCYSGSGTRTGDDRTVRCAGLQNYSILPSLDSDIWESETESRGMQSSAGLAVTGLSSHVLFSACSADEPAIEGGGKGRFTTALLKVFNKTSPDQLTYAQVLDRLDHIPLQNPQLEGKNRHRIFFNAQATSPSRACYKVYRDTRRGFVLKAGEVHGICKGAEFNTVYQDEQHLLSDPIVGVLEVHSILPFETVMRIAKGCGDFTLKNPAVAIQTKAGRDPELKLHVPLEEKYLSVFQALLLHMTGTSLNPKKIALVDHSVADLEPIRRGDKVSFNILDTRLGVHGQLAIPHTVDADAKSVLSVLEAAAHYFYHLNRTHTNPLVQKHVTVAMFKLVESGTVDDDTGSPIYVTSGTDLIEGDKISRGVCDHITQGYGFSIKNTSARDLFVNCFYFDNGDLSITSVYMSGAESHSGSRTDSPLPMNGTLTLGYGSGGVAPQEFVLTPGQDLETGFLKIFISSKPVDLYNVSQLSPFFLRGSMRSMNTELVDIWGSILIPVVLTRHCDH